MEISRIRRAIERFGERFTSRIFTPWEIQYCLSKTDPVMSFAARFAVKEAVFKAIGTGFAQGVKWTSVEVVNSRGGRPEVRLGKAIRDHIGSRDIFISMSHTSNHAIATAILVSDGTPHTR